MSVFPCFAVCLYSTLFQGMSQKLRGKKPSFGAGVEWETESSAELQNIQLLHSAWMSTVFCQWRKNVLVCVFCKDNNRSARHLWVVPGKCYVGFYYADWKTSSEPYNKDIILSTEKAVIVSQNVTLSNPLPSKFRKSTCQAQMHKMASGSGPHQLSFKNTN